jgi:surfeit locus 1 family protein
MMFRFAPKWLRGAAAAAEQKHELFMAHLLTPRWLGKHLLALLVLLAMLRLGFWQLDRLEQKRDHNAAVIAALEQPPVPLPLPLANADGLAFRRVEVRGTLDHAHSMLWRNQKHDGINGVHLLTPLHISDSDHTVLIDRGWLPPAHATPERRAAYTPPGELVIEGIVRRSQPRPDHPLAGKDLPLPGETRIDAWLRVDTAQMQQQLPYPLLPLFIQQTHPAPDHPDALPRPIAAPELDEGPHLSYALQWFTFSGILLVVYAILIRQELTHGAAR